MRKHSKLFLITLAFALMMLLLAGCEQQTVEAPEEETPQAEASLNDTEERETEEREFEDRTTDVVIIGATAAGFAAAIEAGEAGHEVIIIDRMSDPNLDTDRTRDTDTELDTDRTRDTDTELDTDRTRDTDTELDTDRDQETDSDLDTEPDTDATVDTDTGVDTDNDMDTDTNAVNDTEPELDTDNDLDTDTTQDADLGRLPEDNILFAFEGINASGTSIQDEQNIDDSEQSHYDDTMDAGMNNDSELVEILVAEAASTVEWLIDLGADLSEVIRLPGSSNARTHISGNGELIGAHLAELFMETLETLDVEILYDVTAVEILMENDRVAGVEVENGNGETYRIEADTVIIASGGFAFNSTMIERLGNGLEELDAAGKPEANGYGIAIAQDAGAALIDIEEIQLYPFVAAENGEMITEAVIARGAVLINRNGERFVNELSSKNEVSEAILDQQDETAFLIFDEDIRQELDILDTYGDNDFIIEAESIEELAEELGIDADTLIDTLNDYNDAVDQGNDDAYDREEMANTIDRAAFYAIEVKPAVYHTLGGIQISSDAEVLDESGDTIPGLFAAGEATGGIHGENLLAGNALTEELVFGRIAGLSAVDYIGNGIDADPETEQDVDAENDVEFDADDDEPDFDTDNNTTDTTQ